MIPLYDNTRRRNRPFVTIALIIINFVVFFWELTLSDEQSVLALRFFGLIPALYKHPVLLLQELGPAAFLPFLTDQFLHSGWMHILGNMLPLWIFGDNIEDELGHAGFLVFYLSAGIVSNISYIVMSSGTLPLIGASGAIAGVMGAYFVLYPRSKVLALVPLGFLAAPLRIPASWFLLFWFGLQIYNGLAANHNATPVGWWAHVGGFSLGILVALWVRQRNRLREGSPTAQ
jgi:membrane associated rhomboid family serine protease